MSTEGHPDQDLRDLQALRALRASPAHEPPRDLADRVRRQALAELEAATGATWVTLLSRAWMRVALPAAVTVTVVGYLTWAVGAASALYK
ncbi:MAG TPA: hypothetical protein VIF15_21335 [Polyangiaceae bacterium]|jgi:hypothetical protein